MTPARPRILLALAAGFGVWAGCFAVIYGIQGLGCAYGWHMIWLGPLSLLRIILLVLALAGTGAVWLTARWLARIRPQWRNNEAAALIFAVAVPAAYFAVPATLFTYSGVVMTSLCAP